MDKAIKTKTARQLLEQKEGAQRYIAVLPDDTVLQALRVMAERHIGAVLVMSGETLAGIFSERDLARKVELKGKTASGTTVREVMTEKVVCATPSNTIEQCMALMKQKRIRHLPVVEGSRVLGVLSARDVLEELISEEEELIKELQHERLYYSGETGGTY